MKKVVTFGELLLRLEPPGYQRIVQASQFQASFAGSEANVAVSLCQLGERAEFVSSFPDHAVGQAAHHALLGCGVDLSHMLWGGERMGLFYLEKGASQRPSNVIYDRAGSSFSNADFDTLPWDEIFKNCDWFHVSGITPALGDRAARGLTAALTAAKRNQIRVSFDLNYRAKLWSREEARRILEEMMPLIDLCFANESDITDVFGIAPSDSDVETGKLDPRGYQMMAQCFSQKYAIETVAISLRRSLSASENLWGGMVWRDGKAAFSPVYNIHLVDRVGGGDAFAAGYIHAALQDYTPEAAIHFAAAAGCLKQTIEGDFNFVTEREVLSLMDGDTSGRVKR